MLHVVSNIVSGVIAEIDAEYVKFEKMATTQDKIHKYLRMNINYSSPGKIIYTMIDYIGKMLDDTTKNIRG